MSIVFDLFKLYVQRLGKKKDIDGLINMLKYDGIYHQDGNTSVHKIAVFELGQIGKTAVEPLILALNDKNWYRRNGAVDALGMIKDDRAAKPLIAVSKDGTVWRNHAAKALRKLNYKPKNTVEEVWLLIASNEKWGDKASKFGALAVEPLIAVLRSGPPSDRTEAAEALGKIKDARAVEPLIAVLKDKDSYRGRAVWALGEIGMSATESLIATMKDKDPSTRRACVLALGKIKDARAVEFLITALKDKDICVRWCAVNALGKIGDTKALEPLIFILKGKNLYVQKKTTSYMATQETIELPRSLFPEDFWKAVAINTIVSGDVELNVREEAARALGQLGNTTVIGLLEEVAQNDPFSDVCQAAKEALAKIRGK